MPDFFGGITLTEPPIKRIDSFLHVLGRHNDGPTESPDPVRRSGLYTSGASECQSEPPNQDGKQDVLNRGRSGICTSIYCRFPGDKPGGRNVRIQLYIPTNRDRRLFTDMQEILKRAVLSVVL